MRKTSREKKMRGRKSATVEAANSSGRVRQSHASFDECAGLPEARHASQRSGSTSVFLEGAYTQHIVVASGSPWDYLHTLSWLLDPHGIGREWKAYCLRSQMSSHSAEAASTSIELSRIS